MWVSMNGFILAVCADLGLPYTLASLAANEGDSQRQPAHHERNLQVTALLLHRCVERCGHTDLILKSL
jgi:hypothetical protein